MGVILHSKFVRILDLSNDPQLMALPFDVTTINYRLRTMGYYVFPINVRRAHSFLYSDLEPVAMFQSK